MKSTHAPAKSSKFMNTFVSSVVLALVAGTSAALISSCGAKSDSASVDPTFSSIYANVLSQNCATCHTPGGSGPNAGVALDFSSSANAYATIFNNVEGISSQNCSSLHDVSAGNPNSSYLLGVIDTSYQTPNFGGVTGCTPIASHTAAYTGGISSSAMSAIVSWIQSGAAQN